MSRKAAFVDVAVATVAFLFFFLCLMVSELPLQLVERWPRFGALSSNVLLGAFSLILVATILVVRRQGPSAIGLVKAPAVRMIALSILGVPACYVASMAGFFAYALLVGPGVDAMVEERTAFFEEVADFPAAWVLPFSLFAGVHEEILFRGLGLSRLRAIMRSNVGAVVVCGLAFGALHVFQGPVGVAQTTAVGIVLGFIVVSGRSLWPAILAHAAFDCANLLVIPHLLEEMQALTRELETSACIVL